MVQQSVKIAGTSVSRIGHGLMLMTWVPNPVPDEQCFEAIKAGIDALPAGTKAFLNSGSFYAQDFGTGNLQMLSRFFAKYPDYADKTFLSVKGAAGMQGPNCSEENLRSEMEKIAGALGPIKKMDLFEPARVDTHRPIEETMKTLATLVREGHFSHIGISECNADTLRKAHAVHPIAAVEIEISPFSYDHNQKKVLAAAAELGVSVIAYSPLGRGLIAGKYKSAADLDAGDMRQNFTRFKDEAILKHNGEIVEQLNQVAEKRGVTTAQISIAWVAALGPNVIPLPGSSKVSRTLENLGAGDIILTEEELKQIDQILAKGALGDRYWGAPDEKAHLWG
ncbi:unnamed protein product [Mycena citricolor]|uniref:NADP-dependent oxidoreductase domain-containing protein n=1 Tax=Mycena citricolor TaxID=2018698 RepID=A0AAD2HQD2_9AGAR|nr:unnamed protein product [Mycena citricolor]